MQINQCEIRIARKSQIRNLKNPQSKSINNVKMVKDIWEKKFALMVMWNILTNQNKRVNRKSCRTIVQNSSRVCKIDVARK